VLHPSEEPVGPDLIRPEPGVIEVVDRVYWEQLIPSRHLLVTRTGADTERPLIRRFGAGTTEPGWDFRLYCQKGEPGRVLIVE
jgi:hypothetical protein